MNARAQPDAPFLAGFLSGGVVAADVSDLHPLLAARPLIGTFVALFRGGDEEVLVRLAVLRTIGNRADAPRWSRREIDSHFAYLDATKLDTIVKRLADFGLLLWDSDDRSYRVSTQGQSALAALAALMQFAADDDAGLGFLTAQLAGGALTGRVAQDHLQQLLARLTELEDDFAAAVRSGSELQLVAAQTRLESVFLWMEKGTEVIRSLTADNGLDTAGWRIAQAIGQKQSRLARMTGVFARELTAMSRQRVHLSRGGLSTSELAAWLQRLDVDQLSTLGDGGIACTLEPAFVTPDTMLDVAEAELLRERGAAQDTAMPAAAAVAETSEFATPLPPQLPALVALLAGLTEPTAVADLVVADGYRESAYRFSLLPLLGEATSDPVLATLARLPLAVREGAGQLLPVARHGVAAIEDIHLEPTP